LKCSICGAENPEINQFCSGCGKPLSRAQVPAGRVSPKEGSKKGWIIIGAVILLIIIAALFFMLKPPAGSKAPVVGKWAAGNNWVELKEDYSAAAYQADSGQTIEGTWEEVTPTRYQVDWDTGGQDIMIYNPSSQSLAPEGSSEQMTRIETPAESTTPAGTGEVRTTCDPAAEELYLITESNAAVMNNPPNPRVITIGEPVYVTRVMTYHYNSGSGSLPGTIGLTDESGKMYGPWQAVDDKGSTGTPSVHWNVKINQFVPAGKYTIIDSDTPTWSHNSEVGNAGVVWVYVSRKCSTTPIAATLLPTAVGPALQAAAGQVLHGSITTGPSEIAVQGALPASGGVITVTKPGSPIEGLKIASPAGAYPSGQQVTIGSAPVTGNTFGSSFNPATPLIEINAGSAYAEEPVLVTIPVTVPDDQFAMAFYYDEANQKLEGIPTVGQDGSSLTIATRHFSNIVVSLISKGTLDGIVSADSGFRPGVDDWEFDNAGSVVVPKGHCAGQSLTMMWYYTEQRQKNTAAPALTGLFDNNGRGKTPQFPRDNTLGYRFASAVQDMKWNEYDTTLDALFTNATGLQTFRAFKYAILMTGEPQQVHIFRNGGGHAIVCYKVSGTTLYVADPNYHGTERTIQLNGDTLGPYSSGDNSEDIKQNGVYVYPRITYIAKTALVSWPAVGALYAKVKDGTIGIDIFPQYQLAVRVLNSDGSQKKLITVPDTGRNIPHEPVEVDEKNIRILCGNTGNTCSFDIYQEGKKVDNPLTLNEGTNTIAIEMFTKNILPDGKEKYNWLGFDWIELDYVPVSPAPTPAPATLTPASLSGKHYTSRAYGIRDVPGCERDFALSGLYSPDDPYCLPRDQLAAAPSGSIICGYPADSCIEKTMYNNGLQAEHHYYIVEETNTANGEPVHRRVPDGAWMEYYVDGSVMDQWTFKDGVKVG